jgi:tetratricopeptide (TPR) repeat protein
MPEKKKIIPAKNTDRRMSKPLPPKPAKSAEPARSTVPTRSGAVAVTQPANANTQLSTFEAAMKLFHARDFRQAKERFQQAAGGPERDVANRARLHIAMCERRLGKPDVDLKSAEDHYNYGVAMLNTRNVAEARGHLEKALQMDPEADHIHYALAAALALGGDAPGAFESLRRAIELEPRNRLLARQDADLAHVVNQPPFDSLIYPEKKGW